MSNRTIHYGEVAPRKEFKAEPVIRCRRWNCAYYGELYEGEDENGYPYPPIPWCYAVGGGIGTALFEEWLGPQNCVSKFKPRNEP